jgi:hypothetical protein
MSILKSVAWPGVATPIMLHAGPIPADKALSAGNPARLRGHGLSG